VYSPSPGRTIGRDPARTAWGDHIPGLPEPGACPPPSDRLDCPPAKRKEIGRPATNGTPDRMIALNGLEVFAAAAPLGLDPEPERGEVRNPMASIDRPPAKGNLGPFGLRTEVGPNSPEPQSDPRDERLGYGFDPVPKSIRRNPRLKPFDADVLAVLLEFRIWRRDSCWTTINTVANRLRAIRPGRSGSPFVSQRTVQRSIARLKAEDCIRHQRVPKPDPDDPRNLTGWRFYLLFIPVEPPASESPREVTKAPGVVTKESPAALPPAPSPGGEVTKESGDSLVTQGRGEVGELEPTFNVAALAGAGNGATTLPVAPEVDSETPATPPAPKVAPVSAAAATPDRTAAWAILPAVVWTLRELAERLVRRIRDRGLDPRVETGPDGAEVIRVYRLTPSADLLPGEGDELRRPPARAECRTAR
jgi:hypothetical protein